MDDAMQFLNSLNTNQTATPRNIRNANNPLSIQGIPSETLLIHGLSYQTPEFILEDELIATKAAFESFNLVKTKEGESRGFCFLKFYSLKLATNWIKRNSPLIIDGCECMIEYSRPFESGDWNCSVCNGMNYKKREMCYICEKPKGSKAEPCTNFGDRDEGQVENNILLVRGLDKSVTAEEVFHLINYYYISLRQNLIKTSNLLAI
jgi:RNA recognition motif-containing protein